ncbi:SigE family RNA polymerase sigma factor [Nocardioides deserti]|uniref:SigE family RNA polymerase sigma factor n=1 Tax=Nocardioides deserti TaxID=1588644 RepID=A0ABR6UDU1_9ACTN|nr:SigE family RNA polymerase sigma factor [Nocardioides deserti]MBC2962455.1 SigE family RNA polymerase sigma factor [Nocardioides deserti]GGO70515.1 RNA polymerase sigma24 factor [Nocardioides deserti]
MPRPPSDAEFGELVHATWPSLYRTAYLLLGDHAEAEDLVQTALAKTYASWAKVRTIEAAPAYARTVLVNTAASWFRKRGWRNERPTSELPEGVAPASDPADRPTLVAALARLAPRQRAVVVLRYYDDLPVAQVAAALDCSEGTVKSQTSDALARLRTLLGEAVVPHTSGARHD